MTESVVAAGVGTVAGVLSGPAIASAAARAPCGRPVLAPGWWRGHGADKVLLLAATLPAAVGMAVVGARLGLASATPAVCWLVITGVALSLVDLHHHRLPNGLVAAAAVGGTLLLLAASIACGTMWPLARGVVAAVTVFVGLGGVKLLASESLGLGDVKLGAALALYTGWFGWGHVVIGLVLALVMAASAALILLAAGWRGWRDRLALGPSLIAGALVAIVLPEN